MKNALNSFVRVTVSNQLGKTLRGSHASRPDPRHPHRPSPSVNAVDRDAGPNGRGEKDALRFQVPDVVEAAWILKVSGSEKTGQELQVGPVGELQSGIIWIPVYRDIYAARSSRIDKNGLGFEDKPVAIAHRFRRPTDPTA